MRTNELIKFVDSLEHAFVLNKKGLDILFEAPFNERYSIEYYQKQYSETCEEKHLIEFLKTEIIIKTKKENGNQ